MPSDLITKNVDLSTCVVSCKPSVEVSCHAADTPLPNGKAENILRLHFQGHSVEDIARKTYTGTLPNLDINERSIEGSPNAEFHVRQRFAAYVRQVERLIEQAGEAFPAQRG